MIFDALMICASVVRSEKLGEFLALLGGKIENLDEENLRQIGGRALDGVPQ